MPGSSIAVLADDLTGAAEIAAIGKRHGLDARIFGAGAGRLMPFTGLFVFDSDSRLLPADQAADRCTRVADTIAVTKPGFVYKKTDSVLRGNVVAECTALARALGRRRILLAPANPAHGRTIVKGQYHIKGVPLHATAFARDPHHPAKSALIADLLPGLSGWPVISVAPGDELPDAGVLVADVASPANVEYWASRLDAHTLAAGGAEFFQACLRQHGQSSQNIPEITFSGPALVVTGALTPARESLLDHAASARWPVCTLAQENSNLTAALCSENLALIQTPKVALDDHTMSERLRTQSGKLVRTILSSLPLGHLVVEGGATAAAISDANDWNTFDVVGEWSPGVIALRPTTRPGLLLTIKPGSYAWPEGLWHQLDRCHRNPVSKH